MDFTEVTLEREDIFSGRVFDIHKDRVRLPDGKEAFREVVEHTGGVCIAAVDEYRRIYLVEQFRYPLKETTLEVVAGKLERDEDPLDAAARELKEEAGFTAMSLTEIGVFYPSPGFCSEKLHFYLATNLIPGKQNLDEGEFLNCVRMPLEEAVEKVMQNSIVDGKTKALILMVDRLI